MDYIKVVAQYKTSKDKETFIKKRIKTQYVPYVEKLREALNIANASTHIEIDSKQVYKKDTPMMRFLSMNKLVSLYTDITFDNSNVVGMYDALSKEGLMPLLLSSIPATEVSEFMSLVDMCVNDIYENERELSTIIENKLEEISLVVSQVFSTFEETLSQPEVKEDLEDKIKQFTTKDNGTNKE
ncbi:MAG: hypothetical protein K5656_10180 [Lachnospiraceae bacterium]|nr:hypothetical protein [Lachnospiraceae bacterium]